MELTPLYRCVAALDVHQAKLTVCVLREEADGEIRVELREFGGVKRDRRGMARWVASFAPESVVMERTGIYWKSPYAALEQVGLRALAVNARHVSQVPGRKTDLADAQWLAILARSGLLRGGFVPPANVRRLRLISRQMQKLTGILAGAKNRLHNVLTDGGIRLGAVVGDLHGKSGRTMVKALVAGEPARALLGYADPRLKASEEALLDALDGDLSEEHRFVVARRLDRIDYIERQIAELRQALVAGLAPQQGLLRALQTIPGLDETGAAMLWAEIGDDMQAFGSPEKLASWAGVCPGHHESAGKRTSGQQRKGNPYVRRILCEAAHAASRTRCALAEKFKSLLVRRGRKRAIFSPGTQVVKDRLRTDRPRRLLPGCQRRLRGDERGAQCAPLDEDAQEVPVPPGLRRRDTFVTGGSFRPRGSFVSRAGIFHIWSAPRCKRNALFG
jgi:transposase